MNSVDIDIRGIEAVRKVLSAFDEKTGNATLQKATTAGARALKPFVQAQAPVGATRRLRKSVSGRQARRNRPAAVVTARPSIAFYRHMVIDGTKPHEIRKPAVTPTGGHYMRVLHHPGSKPNPFVDRGYAHGESTALAAVVKVLEEALSGI